MEKWGIGVTHPTRDELVKFMKKHAIEKVDSITDKKSAIRHFRATSKAYKEERDEYKKQHDELIEDMEKVKRKAEVWDKFKEELFIKFEMLSKETEELLYCNDDFTNGVYSELFKVLSRMDQLDGSVEFQNLLSELECRE